MKNFYLCVAASLAILLPLQNAAAADERCKTLKANIAKEIVKAQANDEDNEAQGYQRALDGLNAKCDIAGLEKQTQAQIDKLEAKFAQAQTEVAMAENTLAEALNQNDEEKIPQLDRLVTDKQQFLMEQQDLLEVAQAELDILKTDR